MSKFFRIYSEGSVMRSHLTSSRRSRRTILLSKKVQSDERQLKSVFFNANESCSSKAEGSPLYSIFFATAAHRSFVGHTFLYHEDPSVSWEILVIQNGKEIRWPIDARCTTSSWFILLLDIFEPERKNVWGLFLCLWLCSIPSPDLRKEHTAAGTPSRTVFTRCSLATANCPEEKSFRKAEP